MDNGTAVTFRLILPFDCSSAVVAIRRDGELQKYYQLSKEENTEQDGVWWSCTLGPFSVGLYFYYFEFDTPFGHNVLYKGKTDGAVMNSAGRPYQLTVFDQGYTPPDWLCRRPYISDISRPLLQKRGLRKSLSRAIHL